MRGLALVALVGILGCSRDGNPASGFAVAETESYLVRVYAPRTVTPMVETESGLEAYPDELLVVRADVTLKDPVQNSDIVKMACSYDTGIVHPDFAKGGLKIDGYNRAESEFVIDTQNAFPVMFPIIASGTEFNPDGKITITITSKATGKSESVSFQPIFKDDGSRVRRWPQA